MKIKDIRGMGSEDIKNKMTELKKELMKIRAQVAAGTTPKSPGQIKNIKKKIAKILTTTKEKSSKIKEEKEV